MGVYNALPVRALYPGDNYVLSNATLGGSVLTQQVAISQQQGNPANVTIVNGSAVSLTIKVSPNDNGSSSYQALSGGTVAANTAVSFSTTAPFLAVLPASEPGAGVITVCR